MRCKGSVRRLLMISASAAAVSETVDSIVFLARIVQLQWVEHQEWNYKVIVKAHLYLAQISNTGVETTKSKKICKVRLVHMLSLALLSWQINIYDFFLCWVKLPENVKKVCSQSGYLNSFWRTMLKTGVTTAENLPVKLLKNIYYRKWVS